MTDCGEKVKRRELFRSRLQLFISVLRLVNGLTNITSAISLLKFHQLHCLVRDQILICVSGKGWYQEWGKPAIPLQPGDIIDIPEGVKHWHGAHRDSWFQHIATHVKTSDKVSNEWLEEVSDEEYHNIHQ